jgi:hypothetical protein
LSNNSFERPIELGERLETDVVSDLADAPIRMEQTLSRVFHAGSRDVVCEIQASRLVEDLAEMKHARTRHLRDCCE